MFDAAISYIANGWSVISLQPRGKRPLLPSWEEYQSRRPSEKEVHDWFTRWPGANLAVVTGAVSGLVVLDLDGPEAVQAVRERGGLSPTPCVITGKGYHYYLQHPGQPVKNAASLGGIKGLDVRSDGGYVVAPPSVHPSGRTYRWAKGRSPDDLPLAPAPAWLLEILANRGRVQAVSPTEPGWVESLLRGVPEGQRDDAATRLAGHFLGKGLPESEVLALLLAWNQRNAPPMREQDIEKCVRSVAGRESRKPARPRGQFQPGFRLEGPVYAPDSGWHTLIICRDWTEARKLAAHGNAVAVVRKDGSLPPEAGRLVAVAADIKTAGFSTDEARRLAWELYPLRLVSRAATEGTAALKPELKPEPAEVELAAPEPEPAQELEPESAEPPPAKPTEPDPTANRFVLEVWLHHHRPDLLAQVRAAEEECEAAWWMAQAGFPEALRAAEAALAEALEAGRRAMSGEPEPDDRAEADPDDPVQRAERVFHVGHDRAAPEAPTGAKRDFSIVSTWPEGHRGYVDPLEICPVNPLDYRMIDGQWVLDPGWWKRPG